MKHLFRYWLPSIIWMLLIFIFSSRPRFSITYTTTLDFLIFKTLHFIAYAILYFLLVRAFLKTAPGKQQAFLYALALTIAYAISDEIHQEFVPTREGRMRDVLFDTAGATFALGAVKYNFETLKRYNLL